MLLASGGASSMGNNYLVFVPDSWHIALKTLGISGVISASLAC